MYVTGLLSQGTGSIEAGASDELTTEDGPAFERSGLDSRPTRAQPYWLKLDIDTDRSVLNVGLRPLGAGDEHLAMVLYLHCRACRRRLQLRVDEFGHAGLPVAPREPTCRRL